jgi:hypothetical protein
VTVFIDVDGDGVDNDGYSTVTADGTTDANHDGNIDADDVGYFEFLDLDYTVAGAEVKEITPGGYIQTVGQIGIVTDTTTGYTLEGTSGADQDNIDFANFLPDPKIDVEKSVKTNLFDFLPEDGDDDPDGLLAGTNSLVTFKVVVTNTGNETLSGIHADGFRGSHCRWCADVPGHRVHSRWRSDDARRLRRVRRPRWKRFGRRRRSLGQFDTDGDGVIDAGVIEELSPDETFTLYYSLDSLLGQHENTANVEAVSAISDTTRFGRRRRELLCARHR